MQMAEAALGGASSRRMTVSEKCPYAPFSRCPLTLPHSYAPSARLAIAGPGQSPSLIVRSAEAGYRISADRTRQKRGPPQPLAL